ncbi:MFS transporter [Cryobacterium sp. GrIS_2_6]|uniref:MFS transporter n=1 Tax=Cryobacterium sp. GrIS_2_6 TaxID=3162785 RepID=UPI002E0A29CA|nr:MFS family permease [Cryobacterium psychrotolerans]
MTNISPNFAPLTVQDATIIPVTNRPATSLQGILLLIGSCLPVLGAVLLAPILPTLSEVFAAEPGAEALVPLVLTIPALMIAIIAPFAGAIVDRLGRKRLLVGALIAYGILGTAPLYLNGLGAIVLSRVGVGITEAAIMTCCTTLLADYFVGNRRNRYFGLQTVVTSLAATAFFVIGGALGASGWRTPFWLYLASLVLVIPVAIFIWQPASTRAGVGKAKLPPIPWRGLTLPLVVTLFGGVMFYALIVELPYVLDGLGVKDVAIIGAATATASLATAIGAILFRWIARHGAARLLPLALGLAGAGLVVVWFAPSVPIAVIGAVITSFGNGILLPTLLTWAVSGLAFEQRGRGTGLWTGALFFGQFASPLLLLGIGALLGGLPAALGALGLASVALAAALAVALPRRAETVRYSATS